MISIIVATSTNFVIGKDGKLPWDLPSDMKFFKETTMGKTVVMGRGCWESIPVRFRPLPGRENIVITRNPTYVPDGAKVEIDLEKFLQKEMHSEKEVFIIGGADIYEAAFPFASKLYLTQIYDFVDGDLKLRGLKPSDWKLIKADSIKEENSVKFRFELYERKY